MTPIEKCPEGQAVEVLKVLATRFPKHFTVLSNDEYIDGYVVITVTDGNMIDLHVSPGIMTSDEMQAVANICGYVLEPYKDGVLQDVGKPDVVLWGCAVSELGAIDEYGTEVLHFAAPSMLCAILRGLMRVEEVTRSAIPPEGE